MKELKSIARWRMNRLVILSMAVAPLIVLLGAMTLAPFAASPALADHNSLYVVCPGPIQEGDEGRIGIRRPGYKIKKATFFTDHLNGTADSNDYETLHGLTVESNSSGGDTTLWGPIVTKEDTQPEHDETFTVGFWDDNVWHSCEVTIQDDDAPEIVNVEIISEPVYRSAYRAGETIDVAVDLDQKVEAEDNSQLALFLGEGDNSTWRGAHYHSGSGSHSLVYRYVVRPEDFDSDGLDVGAAAVADDRSAAYGFSGSIFAEGTDVPINYNHSGIKGSGRQRVDGRPYVQSSRISSTPSDGWEAYRANQTIEVSMTFNTDVVVEGEVYIQLYLWDDSFNFEKSVREAHYLQGSGTDTLVFGYTVQTGDMDNLGIKIIFGSESTGFGGEGTIKAKGTDVERNPRYLGSGHNADHKVDTDPPAVSSLSFISRPANGEAYAVGETISVEVTFDERVTAQGTPSLEIDVGAEVRQATVRSTRKRSFSYALVFDYTVQESDYDHDGVGIAANRLRLNDGGIFDSAGITVGLSHAALGTDSGQKVDTSAEE